MGKVFLETSFYGPSCLSNIFIITIITFNFIYSGLFKKVSFIFLKHYKRLKPLIRLNRTIIVYPYTNSFIFIVNTCFDHLTTIITRKKKTRSNRSFKIIYIIFLNKKRWLFKFIWCFFYWKSWNNLIDLQIGHMVSSS